jgi:ribosome-associated toxin RatA of RatAB toxin-antitoxin module
MLSLPLVSADWEQAKNKNGVRVFTKEVEGSPLKEFLGKTILEATPSAVVALIKDPGSYTTWLHDCKGAELLKENGNKEWFVYLRNGAPWPVSDRDVILNAKLTVDPKTKAITIRMTNTDLLTRPVPSGVVRIPKLTGLWKIQPLDGGKVEVSYQAHTDPGGNIPDFAANLVVVDIPYNTLSNMKKKVQEPKYATANLDFLP